MRTRERTRSGLAGQEAYRLASGQAQIYETRRAGARWPSFMHERVGLTAEGRSATETPAHTAHHHQCTARLVRARSRVDHGHETHAGRRAMQKRAHRRHQTCLVTTAQEAASARALTHTGRTSLGEVGDHGSDSAWSVVLARANQPDRARMWTRGRGRPTLGRRTTDRSDIISGKEVLCGSARQVAGLALTAW